MNDEKLDLILNVVSEIKNKQDSLEKTVGEIKTKQDSLEISFSGLEKTVGEISLKVDNLSKDFTDFKTQVMKSFATIQNRFALIEKQMVAIGVEIKEEIKAEIKAVNDNIDRLEKEILFARSDSVDTRVKVRMLEERLTRIENHIGI